MIPYGHQTVDSMDIEAVKDVLLSDWLTTGPTVGEFESNFASFCGVKHGVAVANGTAALHCACFAAGIGPGDEVIVSPMTFAASSNSVLYQGGTPVFADVDPGTLLLDADSAEDKVTEKTKAIIAVDYGGQPCDYDALKKLARKYGLVLIADACHSLGGAYRGRSIGSLADMSAFSFHPVKNITTGEGGMITTNNPQYTQRMRMFRNHGISLDYREREARVEWCYEMSELGFNYRISDIQCALGLSQLKNLPRWILRRRAIAERYDEGLASISGVEPLTRRSDVVSLSADPMIASGSVHAYHLYVVRFPEVRDKVFKLLRAAEIGVNVHYIPVYLHPYYRRKLGTCPGLCPNAEEAYSEVLSLPVFPSLTDRDVDFVLESVESVFSGCN